MVPVDRLGREHQVEFLAEALLPEGQADGLAGGAGIGPDAAAADKRGGLLPEERPGQVAMEPAGGYDAVARRRQGRAQRGLRGAGQ